MNAFAHLPVNKKKAPRAESVHSIMDKILVFKGDNDNKYIYLGAYFWGLVCTTPRELYNKGAFLSSLMELGARFFGTKEFDSTKGTLYISNLKKVYEGTKPISSIMFPSSLTIYMLSYFPSSISEEKYDHNNKLFREAFELIAKKMNVEAQALLSLQEPSNSNANCLWVKLYKGYHALIVSHNELASSTSVLDMDKGQKIFPGAINEQSVKFGKKGKKVKKSFPNKQTKGAIRIEEETEPQDDNDDEQSSEGDIPLSQIESSGKEIVVDPGEGLVDDNYNSKLQSSGKDFIRSKGDSGVTGVCADDEVRSTSPLDLHNKSFRQYQLPRPSTRIEDSVERSIIRDTLKKLEYEEADDDNIIGYQSIDDPNYDELGNKLRKLRIKEVGGEEAKPGYFTARSQIPEELRNRLISKSPDDRQNAGTDPDIQTSRNDYFQCIPSQFFPTTTPPLGSTVSLVHPKRLEDYLRTRWNEEAYSNYFALKRAGDNDRAWQLLNGAAQDMILMSLPPRPTMPSNEEGNIASRIVEILVNSPIINSPLVQLADLVTQHRSLFSEVESTLATITRGVAAPGIPNVGLNNRQNEAQPPLPVREAQVDAPHQIDAGVQSVPVPYPILTIPRHMREGNR